MKYGIGIQEFLDSFHKDIMRMVMKHDVATGPTFKWSTQENPNDWSTVDAAHITDSDVCPFPKHKGKLWAQVIEEDPDYVEWLLSGEGPLIGPTLYEKLTEMMEER